LRDDRWPLQGAASPPQKHGPTFQGCSGADPTGVFEFSKDEILKFCRNSGIRHSAEKKERQKKM